MKIVKILIGTVVMIVSLILMQSLIIKPTTTEITVLWDVTDTTIGKPKSEEIIRLFDLKGNNMWNGAEFRLSTLSNVNFNHTEVLSIPSRNNWLSNELERQKEIRTFTSKIALLMDTPQEVLGKPNSSLYWPLLAELKRLGDRNGEIEGTNAQKRILIIQSDLMENNSTLSLYDSKQLKTFTKDPNSAKFLSENLAQLPSLEGIEIYMLYRPMNAVDSERFTLISEVLKNLLQEKGAKVYRSANLIR